MAQLPIDEALNRFKDNEGRLDQFINGDDGYTLSNGVQVESIPAFLERVEGEIEQTTGAVASNLALSESAKLAAETARNIAQNSSKIFETTADAISKGVSGLTSIVGGSGGTNGTFDLAFSGGAGTGAAGRFTVAGGAVVSYIITATGRGYTSAPTVSFAASSGLTGASATVVIADNTSSGEYFYVPKNAPNSTIVDLYKNNAGTAVYVNSISASGANIQLSAGLAGLANFIVTAESVPEFSRGVYSAYSNTLVNTIFGWKSPFKHNGKTFNAVRMTMKASGKGIIRVEVQKSDGSIIASGEFETIGQTMATTYIIPLNRIVSELALNDVGYIVYYNESGVGVYPGYPAGGAYDGSDADPNTYREQYYPASKVWTNAGPIGNYRTQFDLINLAVAGNEAKARNVGGINAANEIRWGVIPYRMWEHPRGDSEMLGDATYAFGNAIGCYEYFDQQAIINAVEYGIWSSQSVDIEWKLWLRDTTTPFNMSSTAADASGTIAAGGFPLSNELYNLNLPTPIKVNAGKYVFVMFRAVNDSTMNIRRFTTAGSAPTRHAWPFTLTPGWNATFAYSSLPAYNQAAARFLFESEELRKSSFNVDSSNVPYSGAGIAGDNVKAAIDELSQTEIVMPPYIFGVQSRECNVYFDNLFIDDAKDYGINVETSASIGTHQDERYTLTPSGALSSGTLTVEAYQKRTGKLITSKVAQLRAAASSAGSGANKKVIVVGDSLTSAGVITQTLLDIAGSDVMGVTLLGTQGTAPNKHEGRGGWKVNDYTTAGQTFYEFTVSGVVVAPDINATEYSHNGSVYRVQTLNLSGGAGTIICSVTSGGAPLSSGTLTKVSGNGDATITFTNAVPVSGNPFWFSGALNFAQYLSANSIATPDWVFIMLGTNDVASIASDSSALSTADGAFVKLDNLIASIKAANANVKIGLMIPPPPSATQDSFGNNYGTTLLRWRFKRNILIWARQLIAKYSGQEASRVYVVPVNTALDTVNNMLRNSATPVNSRNSATTIARQSNGVHPATSGYQQIADAVWSFLKYYA